MARNKLAESYFAELAVANKTIFDLRDRLADLGNKYRLSEAALVSREDVAQRLSSSITQTRSDLAAEKDAVAIERQTNRLLIAQLQEQKTECEKVIE